jgi:predicted HTH transcriptional regulator
MSKKQKDLINFADDMNEKTIREALLKGERVTLECKRAKAEVPKSIWQTYSAFANTIGGLILLGVDEDLQEKDVSKRFQIIGVDEPSKIITDFWNTLNSDKVNENILLDSDVEVVNMDGRQIVCIHVPQADWMAKPIYLNGNVYKGTYRRNNEGDYHCTEAQVKAMIRDSNADGNDSILIEYYGMDDIDPDSLRQYRTEFRQENSTHVWNQVDDKTFLRNLGGYTEDRQTGKEGLTLAGLMMFGKGLAIRDRFSNFRMDYLDMSHLVGDERYHDRLTYDGLWENNLYQFFRIVSPKVQFDLPRPFKLEKGGKRNDDTPQHEAVREAFTNAIIHCDLMMDAGILRIEKHDDRLCFRNPGLLKLPVEAIYRGGNSKARNPKIQNMLRMIGFGENVGSGFPKIIAAWKETNWGEPQLLNKLDVDEVELVLPVPSTKATSDTAPANATANATVNATVKLNKTQKKILYLLHENKNATYEEIAKQLDIERTTVWRNIDAMKKKAVLRRVGEDKNGHWEVLIAIENVV